VARARGVRPPGDTDSGGQSRASDGADGSGAFTEAVFSPTGPAGYGIGAVDRAAWRCEYGASNVTVACGRARRAVTQRPDHCAHRAVSQCFGSCTSRAVSQRPDHCAHRAVASPRSDTTARAIRRDCAAGIGAASTRTGGAVSQPAGSSADRASTRPGTDTIVRAICRRGGTIVEDISPGSRVRSRAGGGSVGAAVAGGGHAPAGGGAGGSARAGTISDAERGGPPLRASCLAPIWR
jgi:hypothetical protein